MSTYYITWDIEVEANNNVEAALKALEIQRDRNSLATVFDVRRAEAHEATRVDLAELDQEGLLP